MTGGFKLVAGWAVAITLTAAVAVLSRVPVAPGRDDLGLIRLAWSARPERIETCRSPTAEEQAEVLSHMRQAQICEGTTAPYRVTLAVDGTTVMDQATHGAGLRHDRPLYFFHEVETAPGVHRVTVRVVRADDEGQLAPLDAADRRRPIPRSLELDTTLRVSQRAVLLVTYDPNGQRLYLRSPEGYAPW